MPWFVYILRSEKDGKRYFGCTEDASHCDWRATIEEMCKPTRHRRPFKVIYTESFESRAEAFDREKFLKTWAGRIELGKLLGSRPDCG